MRRCVPVLLALLLCAVTYSASACGWKGYDFSSLSSGDLKGSDGSSSAAYYLRPCGPLSSSDPGGCLQASSSASACRVQRNDAGLFDSFVVGEWAAGEPAWGFIDEARPERGVQYSLRGARQCWTSGSPDYYVSNVRFECAREQGPLRVGFSEFSCELNYTLPTPLACPGSAPDPPQPKDCTWNGYDLSGLRGRDWPGLAGGTMHRVRVCGVLAGPAQCAQRSRIGSSCSYDDSGSQQQYSALLTGYWAETGSNVKWGFIDPSNPWLGVQYSVQGEDGPQWMQCRLQSNVRFECAREDGRGVLVQSAGACVTNYTFATPWACPEARSFPTRLALE